MFEGTGTVTIAILAVAIDCTAVAIVVDCAAVAIVNAAAMVSYEMEITVKQCKHIL